MSQIIIKNLPDDATSDDLKKCFSSIGTITDVNLKYKNGKFRRFAFIGFKTSEEAQKACSEFNQTCFKQNKIHVELCLSKTDLPKRNTSSRCEFKTNEEDTESPTMEKKKKGFKNFMNLQNLVTREKFKQLMKDPDFLFYLKANEKETSNLVKTLGEKYSLESESETDEKILPKENDEINSSSIKVLQKISHSTSKPKEVKNDKQKKWKDLYTVVIRTKEQNTDKEKKGRTLTKKSVKLFLKPIKYKSLRIPRDISFVAYVGFETEKQRNQVLLKDNSFLDGVRVRIHNYVNEKSVNINLADAPWSAAAEKLRTSAEPIGETGKLFVRNLWYSTTSEDLKQFFEKIGPVADITLPICKDTRKIKGFAHISFIFPEHAIKAQEELDGTSFQGRLIHILPSLIKEDEDQDNLSFKEKKKKTMKSSWHNWNSLFLGSAAVASLLSEKLGRSKQEILTNESSRNQSAAATLALGEAQLVEENKKFLEREGVSLEAFSNPGMQRSSTILLVKNLSAHTTARELVSLFERHGVLGRVLLPPSGVTGIVEFLDPVEAKVAYNDLAYTRFKNLPLYLEWAPIQTFKSEACMKQIEVETADNSTPKVKKDGSHVVGSPENNTTIYVKNLNFKTDEETLKSHFSKMGTIYSVCIVMKRCLSQGYGFVQFFKAADAKKSLKVLQNSSLDGHELSLKLSEKTLVPKSQQTFELSSTSTKLVPVIIVKNIPFESPLSEVKEIFKTFGEISSIRLPRHMESEQHRGFCFVEFAHLESAKNAFASLSPSTHLRGRRLVLDWAKDNESVDDLRKRTAEHFLQQDSTKRRKKVELSDNKKQEEEE